MLAFVEGVGLVGPGLRGWQASRAILAGEQAYGSAPTTVAASELLPTAERRRAGMPVKLALAAGQEAFVIAGRERWPRRPVRLSIGDCDNGTYSRGARGHNGMSRRRAFTIPCTTQRRLLEHPTQCRAPSYRLCVTTELRGGLWRPCPRWFSPRAGGFMLLSPLPRPVAPRGRSTETLRGSLLAPQCRRVLCRSRLRSCRRNGREPRTDPVLGRADGVPRRGAALLAALARGSRETVILEYVAATHLHVAVTPCA